MMKFFPGMDFGLCPVCFSPGRLDLFRKSPPMCYICIVKQQEMTEYLGSHGVKPTANRLLVLGALADAAGPVSMADIETMLDTVDKASIFRVLELFADKDLVHVIDDGSRSAKYELCRSNPHRHHDDQHVHFVCDRCHKVICLDEITVPEVALPQGYTARALNYMIKGTCPDCSAGQDG